jgi:hypothetical protein
MITRVEADDSNPADNHYRILNECNVNCEETALPSRKRTEPEIHYLNSGQPVVFYSLEADMGDPYDCASGVNMLMRALTGHLWDD